MKNIKFKFIYTVLSLFFISNNSLADDFSFSMGRSLEEVKSEKIKKIDQMLKNKNSLSQHLPNTKFNKIDYLTTEEVGQVSKKNNVTNKTVSKSTSELEEQRKKITAIDLRNKNNQITNSTRVNVKVDDSLHKWAKNASNKFDNNHIYYRNTSGTTCWDEAGKYYGIDPWLLFSIAHVESRFNPKAIGKNTNGTYDIGIMQINNKVWLPTLKQHGITEKMLIQKPCVSIYVGAWILRKNINEFGYGPKAIGAYNSRTPSKNKAYARKVYNAYELYRRLYERGVIRNLN